MAKAWDLTQESLLGVFKGIEAFRFEPKGEAWLLQIAHHADANFLRSGSTRKRGDRKKESLESLLENDRGRPGDTPVHPPDQLDRLIDEERLARIGAVVSAMPEQMRTCFILRHDHGYKYREIAVLMRISIQNVRAHLHQARERLKATLALDLGEESEE